MKKSKIFKNSLIIICAVLLAALIEICFFNGIRMYEFKDNKGIISLKDKTEISTEKVEIENDDELIIDEEDYIEEENEEKLKTKEINVLKINVDKIYMDRIVINYDIDTDIKLYMNVKKYDEYGNPRHERIPVVFLKEFKKITKVIESDASNIEIELDYDNNVNLNITDISVKNEFCFNIYRFILITIFLISLALLYILRNIIFKKIEYLFIIIAMCTGLSLIFLTPCLTMYSWDDHIHLDNIYSLFENGEVKTSKAFDYSRNLRLYMNNTPSSYEEFNNIYNYLNDNSNIDGEGMVNEKKYISYSNYTYLPSAIGIQISKWLNLPYTILFYIGKTINLLVYIGIMFYAIKKAKVGKKLLFVLALLPSTIFLASQYSRDAIITAGIYLGLSTFLNCYCTNEKMDRKNLLIFIISIVVASLSKMIYIPYILLLLLMPKEKFTEKKNSKWIKLFVTILFIVSMSTFVLPTANSNPGIVGDIRSGNSSVGSQMEIIKTQPISFMKVFSKFTINELATEFTSRQTFGRWHNFTVINGLKYYLLLIMIIICSICSDKNEKIEKIDKKLRLFLIVLTVFITCLICGSMYLSFTPVGYSTIVGVQPRYYIPLLFGLYITFKQKNIKNNIDNEKIMKIISITILVIYFMMIYNDIFMNVAL